MALIPQAIEDRIAALEEKVALLEEALAPTSYDEGVHKNRQEQAHIREAMEETEDDSTIG